MFKVFRHAKCFYIVSLCNYVQESEEVLGNGDMQDLVTCALIQEKLYTAEKCIGPNTLQKPSNEIYASSFTNYVSHY